MPFEKTGDSEEQSAGNANNLATDFQGMCNTSIGESSLSSKAKQNCNSLTKAPQENTVNSDLGENRSGATSPTSKPFFSPVVFSEASPNGDSAGFLSQKLSEKVLADVAEALIGAHFYHSGTPGALNMCRWLGVFDHLPEECCLDDDDDKPHPSCRPTLDSLLHPAATAVTADIFAGGQQFNRGALRKFIRVREIARLSIPRPEPARRGDDPLVVSSQSSDRLLRTLGAPWRWNDGRLGTSLAVLPLLLPRNGRGRGV